MNTPDVAEQIDELLRRPSRHAEQQRTLAELTD
jgi:hypothetical protein